MVLLGQSLTRSRSAECPSRQSVEMAVILETTHLRLRTFTEGDLDPLAAMVSDPDQMRFYPRPKTRDEASAWIDRNVALYEDIGFGFWFIESKAHTGFLGYCGVRPARLEDRHETELGWHTRKAIWNQGVATEAAEACRDFAFSELGLRRLVAIVHPEHIASRRVAEKIGMGPERETVLDDYPCVIYAL